MRHGIWGIRQAVRQRELDSHAKCPSPLRPDIERQVPAGRCRALQPPGCAACTSPGSSRSRKRWVTPHPLPPSPTHHYDDCPVVPASWGRVVQSPKPPVTRRGKPRHWAPRGANPMSPLLVPDPRAPSGVVWRHVRHTSGPALTTHQPWRAGQVSPVLIVSLTSRSKRQMQRNEGQNKRGPPAQGFWGFWPCHPGPQPSRAAVKSNHPTCTRPSTEWFRGRGLISPCTPSPLLGPSR